MLMKVVPCNLIVVMHRFLVHGVTLRSVAIDAVDATEKDGKAGFLKMADTNYGRPMPMIANRSWTS